MPEPSLIGGNTGNLKIGKGICSFKREGSAEYVDLGNVTDVVLTADVETLDHFTSRSGVRSKDLVVTLSNGGQVQFTMEEFTPHNIGLKLVGDVDELAVGGPEIDIWSLASIVGAFRFVGTNDVGPKLTVDLFKVSITPDGDFGLIEDDWGNMQVNAEVLKDDTVGPTLNKFGTVKITNEPAS
jgi:hypothetical protein